MTVVVLCGGFGTRLKGIVSDVPKVLAPIGDRPFLHHLLSQLWRDGFEDIVLSTGHLGHLVERFVEQEAPGRGIRCVQEARPLGTAGAVRLAADTVGIEGPALVLNGDTFFSARLSQLVHFHASVPEARFSIALARMPNALRYGAVELDNATSAIVAFREKDPENTMPGWVNAGAYVLDREVVQAIPAQRNISLERNVMPDWVGRGLFGCRFPEAKMIDIGTPEDYARVLRASEPAPHIRRE